MPSKRHQHGGFSNGMVRDIASFDTPEGYCWNAENMICDQRGKIRKRGGYTSPSSSNRVAVVENLLGFRSNGVDGTVGMYGSTGKTNIQVYGIDRTTGAATFIGGDGGAACIAARPFQHFNYGIFPCTPSAQNTTAPNGVVWAGGGAGASFNITAATVVGGNNRVTAVAPTSFVAGHLGCIIHILGTANAYIGRIVEVTSSSAVRVEPTPVFSITGAGGWVQAVKRPSDFTSVDAGGRFGVSYGGRIVLGYTSLAPSSTISNGLGPEPNRIRWSSLISDTVPQATYATPPTFVYDGDVQMFAGTFVGTAASPLYNWVDIPSLGGMTGMAVAGEGNLIVFGPRSTWRLSGVLNTETALNPDATYQPQRVSANVGCISERSIQYTSAGLIFCSAVDLHVYDGASMKPLLGERNSGYLQARIRQGDVIYGSYYNAATNHYYLSMSGTDGGLNFNLDDMSMTKFRNMPLFDSAADPQDATKLWGVKWWDTTGAAPTITKGQLWALDPIHLPASTNVSDGDTTAVDYVWESKTFIDGSIETLKRFTQLKVGYDLRYAAGTATASVFADTKLNTSDASYVNLSTTLGTLPETTAPGQKGFRCLPLLLKGQGIEVKITGTTCDSFELITVDTEVQELRGARSS